MDECIELMVHFTPYSKFKQRDNEAPRLDELLGKFYAEIKKEDGEDYEPESQKIMQCVLDICLKENGYEIGIVRGREFQKLQDILNVRTISLRLQGKGTRIHKGQPMTPVEERSLWEKRQLGDFNARVLTNTNFKNLAEQLGLRGLGAL